jgi:hypothetical protein
MKVTRQLSGIALHYLLMLFINSTFAARILFGSLTLKVAGLLWQAL